MTEPQCPVCKAVLPAMEERAAECQSCGAKLERQDDGAWVLAGEAPAG